MTTLNSILKPVAVSAKAMTGEALRRSHWTQAMAGSAWKTLGVYMIKAQDDTCAICGDKGMTRSRIDDPKSVTFHRLLSGDWFSTDTERNACKASNGNSLDPYRFGFVAGNVVMAHTACSQMVYGEKPTEDRLGISPDMILTEWTAEMRKPAKVKNANVRNDMRRVLQARGWMAEG